MHRSLTLRAFFIASNVVLGLAVAGDAQAATPTYYNNQATFNAAIGTSKTDDYSNPGYMFIQNNAQMSAVFNETDYESTGFQNLNIVSGGYYCAGCNGSFKLIFTTTSVGTPQGVEAVGLTIPVHNLGVPYFAFITFGDNTTANIALPAAGSFWGVSAPERITSIHMGLSNGGTTTSGSFGIDNLTIAQSKAVCGNGKVEGMEACDDGNMVDTDMCTNACKVAACGDKIVQMGVEQCDDGNMVDTDACVAGCKNAACGDGFVQDMVEACDDGNKSNASLAKHPRSTAPSLPGPDRCLAGVLRSPREPDRARFAVATTRAGAFLATRRQPDSRDRRGCVAKQLHAPRNSRICVASRCHHRTSRRRQAAALPARAAPRSLGENDVAASVVDRLGERRVLPSTPS